MPENGTREITFAEAVREALAEEMRRDSRVFIMGEDVAEAGTPFKVLSGLVEEFGTSRVVDTPISEAGFTGVGVGAAMTGLRPVVDIMFGDFITLTMDQMVNQAAKVHYMSGGKWKVPMVLRTTLGATRRSAAQHSRPRRSHALGRLHNLPLALHRARPGDHDELAAANLQAIHPYGRPLFAEFPADELIRRRDPHRALYPRRCLERFQASRDVANANYADYHAPLTFYGMHPIAKLADAVADVINLGPGGMRTHRNNHERSIHLRSS